MTDINELASKLTPQMRLALTTWCQEGVVHKDVEDATKRGLVTRGLATWFGGDVLLTGVGERVREVLMAKEETG